MVIESIREFNHAVPFVPYEIHTVSGETYEVPHPDFILVSPRGSYVIVIDPKIEERPHHINALLIDRASPLNGHKRRKTREAHSEIVHSESVRGFAASGFQILRFVF